ncbi:MAG: prolipoprotein diacylglyceryl transferase [Lachnospiraceae bacterium]|nr:prolipoprotein diacylglyceryl transferase [Lachnospiraceae bacterium]
MYNDLFSIGPVTVHGYGLMIAIGVVVAMVVSDKRAGKRGLNGELVYGMTVWTIVLGFLSAKVLYIITCFKDFLTAPMSYIKGSGFVVFGGIIGGVATIWGYCKAHKVSFIDMFDLVVPSVALAQGFGRIGCLLAGCCYGRETQSSIGIVFTHSDFAPNGVKLMPTQIMMSVGDFINAALLFYLADRIEKKIMVRDGLESRPYGTEGRLGIAYLAFYSIGRFVVEFFRNDYRGSVGILSTSQFIAILVLAGCICLYYFRFIRKKKSDATVE